MCQAYNAFITVIAATCLLLLSSPSLTSSASSPEELLQVATGAFSDGFFHVAEAQFREFRSNYPDHPLVGKVTYLLGKALFEQKKFEKARTVFSELVGSPHAELTDDAHFWLAHTCQQLEDAQCAEEHYLSVVQEHPKSTWRLQSLYTLGTIYVRHRQYAKAEEFLRRALDDDTLSPTLSPSVQFWLALSLFNLGKYSEATVFFNKVAHYSLESDHREEALYWLGEAQVKLKDYHGGHVTFRTFLEQFPTSELAPNALFGKSWCLYNVGRLEDVLKNLALLRNGYPHSPLIARALFLTGEVYVGLNQFPDAITTFRDFINRFPDHSLRAQSLLYLGWSYLKQGDFPKVKEMALEIAQLSPSDREKALAQYILAELHFYEGNCDEALPYWFNVLNVSAYRDEALFKIAMCSFRQEKYKESLVNLDLLRLEYPNFSEMDQALWMQAESYRKLGNTVDAAEAYKLLVKDHRSSPWYPWSLDRLIDNALGHSDPKEAQQWFRQLYRTSPAYAVAYEAALKLGIWHAEGVEYEKAMSYLDIAIRCPDDTVVDKALSWKGEIYFNLRQYHKALDAYGRIVAGNTQKQNTFAALAALEMGNIRRILADHEGAADAYKRAIELSPDEPFVKRVRALLKELNKERGKK
jgi:TolA-binding protein